MSRGSTMHIEDVDGPRKHIIISDRRNGSRIKSLSLDVEEPGSGEFAPLIPKLADVHHVTKWSSTDTREVLASSSSPFPQMVNLLSSTTHVADLRSKEFLLPFSIKNLDKSSWIVHPSNFGETSYTKTYWEWTEYILAVYRRTLMDAHVYDAVYASLFTYDRCENVMRAFCNRWCPSTNTLHTPIGEMSISIWDLYSLAGLRATGFFFDEVVPSAKELFSRNGPRPIPLCCKFLFFAFFRLADGDPTTVTFERWVQFWFRGPVKYDAPPKRLVKKKSSAHPKVTHNPSPPDNRTNSFPSSMESSRSLEELQIPENLRADVHLAAFFSCWICKFLLPGKVGDCIRPGVFKVASFIARGRPCSLAIPVLCSIYTGLGEITHSSSLTDCRASFPIHFVYAWIAHNFDSHFRHPSLNYPTAMVQYHGEKMARYFSRGEAAKLFERSDLNFHTFLPFNDAERVLVDDGNLSSLDSTLFISIRSCYLTLRRGKSYLIAPYSPHRFSRQFGFCQDVPGSLKTKPRCTSVKELMALWESSVRRGSMSTVTISASSTMPLCTKEYDQWRNSATYKSKVSTPTISSTCKEGPTSQVTEAVTCLPPVTPQSQVVGVCTATVNSNNLESSESATASDDDCDRPWNRPSKKRRSSPILAVPLDSLEDIPLMEGVPSSTMSPRSLMNHNLENVPFVDDLLDDNLASPGGGDFADCSTSPLQLGGNLPCQDPLILEMPPNLLETIPSGPSEDALAMSTGFETVDSIRQVVIDQLAHTPIEKVPALEKSVTFLMEDVQHAGLSDFKTSLLTLFDRAREYNSEKVKYDSLMTNEAYQERFSAAQERLEERKASLKETLTRVDDKESELAMLKAKVDDMESELAVLKAKVDDLSKRQKYYKEESRRLQSLVQTDEKMFSFVQHFSHQSVDSTKKLEHVKDKFEAQYQAVMKWKPL